MLSECYCSLTTHSGTAKDRTRLKKVRTKFVFQQYDALIGNPTAYLFLYIELPRGLVKPIWPHEIASVTYQSDQSHSTVRKTRDVINPSL
jgi:hypothetical protein